MLRGISFVFYSVTLMKITSKFCVKVSQMGVAQQPLIRKHSYLGHGYLRGVCLHSMNFGPRVHAPGWGWSENLGHPKKVLYCFFSFMITPF